MPTRGLAEFYNWVGDTAKTSGINWPGGIGFLENDAKRNDNAERIITVHPIDAHCCSSSTQNPALVFLIGMKLSSSSAELSDFDVKIAMADMTTGENSISKFLIANQESLKPKALEKRIGTNVMKTVPKNIETTAIGLERG